MHRLPWQLYRVASALTVLLAVVSTTNAADTPPPGAGVSVSGEIPTLVVDPANSSGHVWLLVRNGSQSQAPLVVTVGKFVSKATGQAMTTEATFFKGSEAAGTPFIESNINPGVTLPIKLQVTNLWEAGDSTADLIINGRAYQLPAVNTNVPFNVSLQAPTPDKPQLDLAFDQSGLMILKNEDRMSYPAVWRLFIPNVGEVLQGSAQLPPKSTVTVTITPPAAWFTRWFAGLFKDEQRNAVLTLRYAPKSDTDAAERPVKSLPVALRLARWSDTTKDWVGNFILFLVLALGGLSSLLLGLWIPNKLVRIDLARRLDTLAARTRDISSRADSSLRVSVRVERTRLSDTLTVLGALSPEATAQAKLLEKEIEVLRQRVECVNELDDVAHKLDELRARTSGAPPTMLRQAARLLHDATNLLKLSRPTEADLQAAQTAIRTAGNRLDKIDQEDLEFAKELATRIKELRKEYDAEHGTIGMLAKCKALRPKLVDLFEVLKYAQDGSDALIPIEKYHWIDLSIEKLVLLGRYIKSSEDSATDALRNDRIAKCEETLIGYLRLQNSGALDLARGIIEQINEDLYAEDVRNQLSQLKIRVRREPVTTYVYTPVQLWIEFDDRRFDRSAAREAFQCIWEFDPAVGEEHGWEIAHYFRSQEEATFKVKFKAADGSSVTTNDGVEVLRTEQIPVKIRPKDQMSDRAKMELWRLLLALSIALLALIAGAREQILKLDLGLGLVAVFLIGFGADSIKNLFTKRD